jgi:hypothetical protein
MQENLNQHFQKLPLHLQSEVMDFVLFLEQKHMREPPRKSLAEKLMEIPDVGLDEDFERIQDTKAATPVGNEAYWKSLEAGYREMAQDETAEAEALKSCEALIGDIADYTHDREQWLGNLSLDEIVADIHERRSQIETPQRSGAWQKSS